jgi:hypothetical protein
MFFVMADQKQQLAEITEVPPALPLEKTDF